MDLVLDSWNVLIRFRGVILAILFCAAWGGILVALVIKKSGGHFETADYLALAIAGWPVPALLAAIPGLMLGLLSPGPIHLPVLSGFMAATGGTAIYMWMRVNRDPVPGSRMPLVILGSFLPLLIFLRLAFISGTLLPQYFDSAEHYRIARVLAEQVNSTSSAGSMSWPAPTYYHIGFHVLTAMLAASLPADIKSVMLVSGQVLLACIPIPFFFIVRLATRSLPAGLWAVCLAAFGWFMPAHAVDWGKYPALAGILTIQLSAYLAYLLGEMPGLFPKKVLLQALLLCSLTVSFLLHTRSVIVIAILVLSWVLAGRWMILARVWQSVTLALSIGLLAAFVLRAGTGDLGLTFDPYLHGGALVTGIVILFFPFGLKIYPRPVTASLLSILLMCGGLLVPVPGPFPGFGGLTLLDRPLVEMLLFMPLTWIGGLGFAGLLQTLRTADPHPGRLHNLARAAVPVLLAAFIAGHSFAKYDLYPSDCCRIAGYDDVAALDWLDENLPPDSVIAIAAAELTLRNPGPARAFTGIDAGIWITSLTGRRTVLIHHPFDFGGGAGLRQLCEQGISHVYAGGEQQSFMASMLNGRPEWYRQVFYLPGAQIYELHACP